jgi:hypothetical protein
VNIKTLHGVFSFDQQMYQMQGRSVGFIELSNHQEAGYVSRGLQELVAYYSNRLSYEELQGLLVRMTGAAVLSPQGSWDLVQQNVQVLSDQRSEEFRPLTETERALVKISLSDEIDLYHKTSDEILLFDDGILVKAQKEQREKPVLEPVAAPIGVSSEKARVNVLSDVVLLQIAAHQFEYVFPPIHPDGTFRMSLEAVLLQRLYHHYGTWTKPLPLVVISDGASVIRKRLERIFGDGVCIILDWYHLSKKVRDLMSMIAQNKLDKAAHIKALLPLLWHGNTSEAITYLSTQINVRNPTKHQELLTYLEKHQAEIIDYQRRQQAGKSIGSGRMEKAVDQVIGHRQKRKGMSWRPAGSRALAWLKVLELNGEWDDFWFPSTTNESTDF